MLIAQPVTGKDLWFQVRDAEPQSVEPPINVGQIGHDDVD